MTADYATLTQSHPQYPERVAEILREKELCALGSTSLLSEAAIGICGSRNASPQALEYAFKFGSEAAQQGLVVVSGYARGIDRQAHLGALQAGGATIAILAEGIEYFSVLRELRPFVDLNQNFLALSMFHPDEVWKSWRAMERNKLIVGLSSALFVVEAREKGGTMNAAMECVRQGKPLWAISYSEHEAGREGNRKLVQSSAIPLVRQGDLKKALQKATEMPAPGIKQLAMNID
jgi:DNA processing protein